MATNAQYFLVLGFRVGEIIGAIGGDDVIIGEKFAAVALRYRQMLHDWGE